MKTDQQLLREFVRSHAENAFAELVKRHIGLVYATALRETTGNSAAAQDVTQLVFIELARKAPNLQQHPTLAGWLYTSVRFVSANARRAEQRRINREEEAHTMNELLNSPETNPAWEELKPVLDDSLHELNEHDRDAVLLRFFEGKNLREVGEFLSLSENSARMRVDRALEKLQKLLAKRGIVGSASGLVIVISANAAQAVPAGLAAAICTSSAIAGTTVAGTVGATVAQGTTAAKASITSGFFTAFLGPVLVFFGTWLGYKMSMDGAESDRERDSVKKGYCILTACIIGFGLLLLPLIIFSKPLLQSHPVLFVSAAIGLSVAYVMAIAGLSIWWQRDSLMRLDLRDRSPVKSGQQAAKPTIEYRSKSTLLGLPLVHVRLSGIPKGGRTMVKAWFAVGDSACGVIFAFGGLAIAPISIGGLAIGLFSFGGFSVGLLGLGGFCIAWWAIGGMALGVQAFGGCALAWEAAMGGLAIAREFALGATTHAPEANNAIAARFIRGSVFFRAGSAMLPYMAWLNLIWVIPMILWWRTVARRRKQQSR